MEIPNKLICAQVHFVLEDDKGDRVFILAAFLFASHKTHRPTVSASAVNLLGLKRNNFTICKLETPKPVLWQTVKT